MSMEELVPDTKQQIATGRKLPKGCVPFADMITIRTAHDVRKLRACPCGEMGFAPNMLAIDGREFHGRCAVAKYGIEAISLLSKEQKAGLMLGDIGVEAMKKLCEATHV